MVIARGTFTGVLTGLLNLGGSPRWSNAAEMHEAGTPSSRVCRAILFGLLLFSASSVAEAHGPPVSDGGPARGLEIPAITHAEMRFVSPYSRAILDLADRQTGADERLRRLLNFTKIQKTYCFWGLFPGAVTNEESIFNLCSHAYLAGSWALLQQLTQTADAREEAVEIIGKIAQDQLSSSTSVLCEYSADTFHTAEYVVPVKPVVAAGWLVSFFTVGGLSVALGGSAIGARLKKRR